jgi:flagellar basal-body rod protein FlgC
MVNAMPLPTDTAEGGGVAVAGVVDQAGDPAMMYQPDSPLADGQGYVQGAVVDLPGQMGDLILASRSYQANLSVFKEARDALQVATTLGRG